MILRTKGTYESSRNLLPYFMESKQWKEYETNVVNSYMYWIVEDPKRAQRMFTAANDKKKGYTVKEYIYDMLQCIYEIKIKTSTRERLYNELDALESWHEEAGTLEEVM